MTEANEAPGELNWHTRLRQVLVSYFNEDELQALCFDLRVDYDDLEGENKTQKTIALIMQMARLDRIDELISLCSELRPNIPWSELRLAAQRNPLIIEEQPDQAGARPPAWEKALPPGRKRMRKLGGIVLPTYVALALTAVFVISLIVVLFIAVRALTADKTTMVAPAPESTAVPAAEILLATDFESSQSQAWLSDSRQIKPHIVTLPGGNRALQIQSGVEALYTPSWDWTSTDYRLEADMMVADLRPDTSIGWNARILNNNPVGYCQGYRAEIGPDYAALHLITAPRENCASSWQYETLNYSPFRLQADEWHHLRLDVAGNRLRFYIDGSLALTATDPENRYPSGGIGLMVFESEEAYVDNLVITALPAIP